MVKLLKITVKGTHINSVFYFKRNLIKHHRYIKNLIKDYYYSCGYSYHKTKIPIEKFFKHTVMIEHIETKNSNLIKVAI